MEMKSVLGFGRMKMLNEIDRKVCTILAHKGMEKDLFIGLTSILSKKNAFDKMLEWLEQNNTASIGEIKEKVLDLCYEE